MRLPIVLPQALLACLLPILLHAQAPPGDGSRLARLVSLLRDADVDVRSRRGFLALSESRVTAASAREPATLFFEIEGVPNAVDVTQAQQARLLVEQRLFVGARTAGRRDVAAVEVEAAQLALQSAERAVEWRARRAIVRWQGALAIADRLASEDALLQDAEAALRASFASGEARYVDVLRVRTERLRVQSERVRQARVAATSRSLVPALVPADDSNSTAVAALLDSMLVERREFPLFAELPPPPRIDTLLTNAAITSRASLGVRRAEAEARLLSAEQRTDITAGAGVQRFQANDGSFTLGPAISASLTLPFTARKSREAQRAVAGLAVTSAATQRTLALARLRSAVQVAIARYEAAREQVRVFETALLVGAREERETALSGFRTQQLSLLELIDFERALSRAEIDRYTATIDAVDALADLNLLLAGTSSAADLTDAEYVP